MSAEKSELFDVTMGAYDGADVCELMRNFILPLIGETYDINNVGLYSDNDFAVLK